MSPQWAMAMTPACTVISNTATLSYSVGGTGQPTVSNTAGSADFTVGNKVVVTVEKVDGNAVSVVPNSTSTTTVLKFTVTNTGNALQDYTLAALNPAGAADPFGGAADSFDLSGVTVRVESGAHAGYQAGEDTATTILALDPTATLAGESVAGTKTVYIVPTAGAPVVPAGLANAAQSVYVLEATSLKGAGTAAAAEANSALDTIYKIGGGSCSAAVQFAEGTHTTNKSGEAANDGKDTARDTFKVATATIAVSKTSAVYSDPINGTSNPKAIPGAVVRYTVSIANTGAASANLTTISDTLDNALRIVPAAGGASWAVTGSARTTTSGTLTADTADANTDGLGHANTAAVGGALTATLTTILPVNAGGSGYTAGELKPGETVNLVFDVTLQ